MANCAFDSKAFDDAAFDVCVSVALGGVGGLAGGSAWDERFISPRLPKEDIQDDEEGLILAYWYARENYML